MSTTTKRTQRARTSKRVTKKTGDVRSMPGEGKVKSGPPSGKGIRYLRGLGHHLDPIVQIGKEGVSEAVIAATKQALLDHELVKVRVAAECPTDRKEASDELAKATGAILAQVLGRTMILYKRHPREPKIVIPK